MADFGPSVSPEAEMTSFSGRGDLEAGSENEM